MSFVSLSLAVIVIIRLFSTSAFRVPKFSVHNRIWRAQTIWGALPLWLQCKKEGCFWKNVPQNKVQHLPVAFEFVVQSTSILAKTNFFYSVVRKDYYMNEIYT